jgi:hypothetical protein
MFSFKAPVYDQLKYDPLLSKCMKRAIINRCRAIAFDLGAAKRCSSIGIQMGFSESIKTVLDRYKIIQ